MACYHVTPTAQADLMDIYHYSRREWGERQADKYYADFIDCFCYLSDNPRVAKHRKEFPREVWSYSQGSHLVFFILRNERIEILRILHKSTDYQRHLQ